jgi:purine-binding chemotaxis protein CheW
VKFVDIQKAIIVISCNGRTVKASTTATGVAKKIRVFGGAVMSELQVVVFSLNNQTFGAEASQVFQIIRYQEAAKVPRMPKFIEGIINYRGAVLPVISLNRRFELGDTTVGKKTKIIVSNIEGKLAGFVVNDVVEIARFGDEDVEPAPVAFNSEVGAFLKKVAKKGDRLISIIDLDKVLEDSEIKRLTIKVPENATAKA